VFTALNYALKYGVFVLIDISDPPLTHTCHWIALRVTSDIVLTASVHVLYITYTYHTHTHITHTRT